MLSHTVLLWAAGRGPVWPLAAVGRIARGWVPALLLAAQCSPHILLTELQAMLKGVSEGKSLGPSAILPRAHSQVRGWGGSRVGNGTGPGRSGLCFLGSTVGTRHVSSEHPLYGCKTELGDRAR